MSKLHAAWNSAIIRTPRPAVGCFTATYPSRTWNAVQCAEAPAYPEPPRQGARPTVIGNRNDVSAQVPSGHISTATGTFPSVTGVTSESGPIANSGPAVANAYTLQVNTNTFASTACAGSPNTGCLGWEQFVFENRGTTADAFIQYWLIQYDATCPAGVGWHQFQFTGQSDIYCWKDDPMGVVPIASPQPITNLQNLSLSGTVGPTGDTLTFSTGTTAFSVAGDNAVNAAAGWTTAEFNVFGDAGNSSGGGQANFNSGASVVPKVRVIYGGTAAPTCVAQGFTGETNNLIFGPTAPATAAPGPALAFQESSAGGSTSSCAAATTVGDTHLATFSGLLYDFQASGDFVLAKVNPGFVVQTRQVSGAPTWPNATVNHAVATQMGKTRVAVCAGTSEKTPQRINVDGRFIKLADGGVFSLPDGVDIRRQGNVYLITSASGYSVRATVNATWIDVSVGLGRWPVNVRGLVANANANVNEIQGSDGTVLSNPFSFGDLYGHYANSWRVPAKQSLLNVCGIRGVTRGAPKQPFTPASLDPKIRAHAVAVCKKAGVKAGPLLDACTIDVAVIGNGAARVYVGAPAPVAVGKIVVVGPRARSVARPTVS